MGIDGSFLDRVRVLSRPDMGTELMAPLLHSLVRSLRPVRLLEIGAGYTTPFILQALAENHADAARERRAMIDKTWPALVRLDRAADARTAGAHFDDWLCADPVLGAPAFHHVPHAPKLHTIDRLAGSGLGANQLRTVIGDLGLQDFFELHVRDFRGLGTVLGAAEHPFDFVWFDCGHVREYEDFLAEYWDAISQAGGLLILHLTLNDPDLNQIVRELKRQQSAAPDRLEVLSLAEPHKATQGSFTLVRRLGAWKDPICEPIRLVRDARRLLQISEAEVNATRTT